MAKDKRCFNSISWFACLPNNKNGPFAQSVSSEIAPSPPNPNDNINPSPTAMSTEENHTTSSSANAAAKAKAIVVSNVADNNDNVADDEHQALTLTSSSGVTEVSYFSEEIGKEVEKDAVDLDKLSNYILKLLEFMEAKRNTKPKPKDYGRATAGWFSTLSEVLSKGIDVVKEACPGDTPTIVVGVLKGLGEVHLVATGFLVVANMLERYETVVNNKEECRFLLKDMNQLAQHIKKVQEIDKIRFMRASIQESVELIVEASLMCCTQIDASKFSRFFSATITKEELGAFQLKLQKAYMHLNNEMTLSIYSVLLCNKYGSDTEDQFEALYTAGRQHRSPVEDNMRNVPEHRPPVEDNMRNVPDNNIILKKNYNNNKRNLIIDIIIILLLLIPYNIINFLRIIVITIVVITGR